VLWSSAPRVVVRPSGGAPAALPVPGPGTFALEGVEVTLDGDDRTLRWSVANPGRTAVALDAVGVTWDAGPAGADPRCFVHGYQSWSPSGGRRLGRDGDPSRHPATIPLARAAYHADPGVAAPGELRSEQVTVLAASPGPRLCLGFDGGEHHAGTLRVRLAGGHVEVTAEAWLGGAVLPAGATRDLHTVTCTPGDDVAALLDGWAAAVGRRAAARVEAPYQAGWCSWYHYFHDVDEKALHANLARAAEWPFEVFQLDDGYQSAIGDWLVANDRFPSGVDGVAAAIAAAGRTPGIWIAPFLAAPTSKLAAAHPERLAGGVDGAGPAIGMFHEVWGGVMWQLDTTHPEVHEHLRDLAAQLVAAGYGYLKLDFTFSAALPGRFHDPTRTPAERVRAGYAAIREGAGDAFVLACGCPIGPVVGLVDGMRIGPDVAPWWEAPGDAGALPGYEAAAPATRHAFDATLARAHQHRRLWLADPDCLMLRRTATRLAPEAARAWALTVACSGGLAIVSDDLALLGPAERRLLDEVLAIGRGADAAARAGAAPRAEDLLDPAGPTSLTAAGRRLVVDRAGPRATLSPA
jgi:alpha-galactosidase